MQPSALAPTVLDLGASSVDITRQICDVPSVSDDETPLADAIVAALVGLAHLEIIRDGDTVVARTDLGRPQRVVIAGHIDTVPINENLPTRFETLDDRGEYLWGRGTVDMKSGVAVQLKLAAELTDPAVDITWMWYDHEEVSAALNGLGRLATNRPDLFAGDFAILGEPSNSQIEGGCNGNLRVEVRAFGLRAHSARGWVGENAIHKLTPVLETLSSYEARNVEVDGLVYREGLNAVGISGGVAGNVIPDEAMVHVNYRFAPSRSGDEAIAHLRELFAGFEVTVVDLAEGARPGLDAPLAQQFLAAVGGEARPKYGWTDVARFSALGMPAVNFGPGDPMKAHADDERVLLSQITDCENALRVWLTKGELRMTRAADDLTTPPRGADDVTVVSGIQSRMPGRGGVVGRVLRERWWVRVLLVFAAGRVVTTTMLLALASVQGPNPWTGASPSYFAYASIWDGTWYKIIAYWGYPHQLPLGTDGHISQNAWAFLPGYPFLVRGLTEISTIPWEYTSVFVSFAFGVGSTLLFYKLMRRAFPAGTSLFAVALFTLGPSSPMFQVAYAETMGLFFVMLGLHLLLERKYWLLFPVIVAMSLSRPSGLAFALCLALHLGYRWFARQRDPFARGDLVLAIAATGFSAFMGVFWSLVAWIGTGYFPAYTDTELAWRASYIGYQHLVPFASWFQGGNWWLGAPAGAIVVVILVAAFALWMATRGVRRLPIDLRFWVIAYAVYLLAVFFPQSSTFRLLIPLFPLLGVMAIPRSRVYRVVLIILFVAAQAGWLLICWGVNGSDWTPP